VRQHPGRRRRAAVPPLAVVLLTHRPVRWRLGMFAETDTTWRMSDGITNEHTCSLSMAVKFAIGDVMAKQNQLTDSTSGPKIITFMKTNKLN